MTLIAFATYGDRAEIICDTGAYTPYVRTVSHRCKIMPMPHINALLATQGDHVFGVAAGVEIGEMEGELDAILDAIPTALREAWRDSGAADAGKEGSVFLIGHSRSAGKFVAFRFLAERDFSAEEVTQPHVMPTPLHYRPSDFEFDRLLGADPRTEELREDWMTQAVLEPPASREEWIDLALKARSTRALQPTLRVIVAGKLLWTRLSVGRVRTEIIHEFNDTGDELDQLVAGTLHPRAQIAPCPCGSGVRALECCIPVDADKPCPCNRFGKTFGDCCTLTPEQAIAAESMGLT